MRKPGLFSLLVIVLAVAAAADLVERNEGVSTGDYGTDVSYPMHHAQVTGDVLGKDKQQLYQDNMKGCFDYYNAAGHDGEAACLHVEHERIQMNLRQPQSMINYTKNGFVKIRAPDNVWKLVQEFWKENRDQLIEEDWGVGNIFVNHWKVPVQFVALHNATLPGGGLILENHIWNAARDTLSEWTGHQMADCSCYGIRVYREEAILVPHVDRLPLVSSAILNVDQDLDEPWPLEVIGHDGRAHNVTMVPGDMILYESHSIIHGRPFPLKGRFMANVFMHFEPVAPLSDANPVFQGDLPPYVIPGSPEEANWRMQNPDGWYAVQSQQPTSGTTETHQAVVAGDLEQLQAVLDAQPSHVNAQDEFGWSPLHEAVRARRVDVVAMLVDRGADIHAMTNVGESVLELAYHFIKTEDPNHKSDPGQHPLIQFLTEFGARVVMPARDQEL